MLPRGRLGEGPTSPGHPPRYSFITPAAGWCSIPPSGTTRMAASGALSRYPWCPLAAFSSQPLGSPQSPSVGRHSVGLLGLVARSPRVRISRVTDARLRELERRWNQSGSVEDEAALLQERVRAGDLDEVSLARVGHLGYPAAKLALSLGGTPPNGDDWTQACAWLRVVEDWGVETALRAAVAALRAAWSDWWPLIPFRLVRRGACAWDRARSGCGGTSVPAARSSAPRGSASRRRRPSRSG